MWLKISLNKNFDPVKYENTVTLENIPKQWISQIELYYPDLPQFPIIYVHKDLEKGKLYGFPASVNYKTKKNGLCDAEFLFLSNIDLTSNTKAKEMVKEELEERIGLSEKIGKRDILASCNGKEKYEDFFEDLWEYISKIYGEFIPYGRFYEEVFSIVRFTSAWNPKTGRQSEMRMLYNFLSNFGERIKIGDNWNHLEFFLLPNYDDILNKRFENFPNFKSLFDSIEKIWDDQYSEKNYMLGISDSKMKKLINKYGSISNLQNVSKDQLEEVNGIGGHYAEKITKKLKKWYKNKNLKNVRCMESGWPPTKRDFISEIIKPMVEAKKIDKGGRENLEKLVDVFNRHPGRASFFIWNIMNIFDNDYRKWNKKDFLKFYINEGGTGVSEKTVACFLQQGFKNEEVIPIDNWVESFYKHALGIRELEDFLTSFRELGKMERAIWLSSQANKTNIRTFFYTLWCTRYGDRGNNELRQANPLSCFECELTDNCPSFSQIKNSKLLVANSGKMKIKTEGGKNGGINGQKLKQSPETKRAKKEGCKFICLTENRIPKKIFIKRGEEWRLIDEFSGYILQSQETPYTGKIITVKKFIEDIEGEPPQEK